MALCELSATPIAGLFRVERQRVEDARGFLLRLFNADEFRAAGLTTPIAAMNLTLTRRRGTLRGMHFQRPPQAESKIVTCIRGEVFDVAVDLRRRSQTFLRWHAEVLSSTNQRSLLIPEGCAHGFQTLTDDCELLYAHTAAYHPSAEGGVHAADPRLGIEWPLPFGEMSERDRNHPLLLPDYQGLEL